MSKAATIKKNTPFQEAMSELEAVVEKLESGEQSLEASLADFERGVALARHCKQSLSAVEQKVQLLMEDDKLVDFEAQE